MSRNNKARRKEKKRKEMRERRRNWEKRKRVAAAPDVIAQAASLSRRGMFVQAHELLDDELLLRPDDPALLMAQAQVCNDQEDYDSLLEVCQRLVRVDPQNLSNHLMLASAMMMAGRPGGALLEFRRLVERWPDDPLTESARDSIRQLDELTAELWQDFPSSGEERIEFAALHEELVGHSNANQWRQVIDLGERLHTRAPGFASTLNNLAEAYFCEGQAEKAIAASRSSLVAKPDNFHALANLARHLFLLDRREEAETVCEQLRDVSSDRNDLWVKQAETFTMLGRDSLVLEALADAERAGAADSDSPETAALFHYAAVALARQGDDDQATRYWEQALEIRPEFDVAEENLADADEPAGERWGPWGFGLDYWGSVGAIGALRNLFRTVEFPWTNRPTPKSIQRFAAAHPEIVRLIPDLLERGDPEGQELALFLALQLQTPEMFAMLKEYAFSTHGPDVLRLMAVDFLCRREFIPSTPARMWIEGKWQETVIFGFEINSEPASTAHFRPGVADWHEEGFHALRRDEGELAERLFRKCIAVQGDEPSLLNNLAAARGIQGYDDEARKLVLQIHERWPDYSFARISIAQMAIEDRDYPRAEALLAPILASKRLHASEFTSLAPICVRLYRAMDRRSIARRWLNLWQKFAPEDPRVILFETLDKPSGALAALRNVFASVTERLPSILGHRDE